MTGEPIVVPDAGGAATASRRLTRQGLRRVELAALPVDPWDLGRSRMFVVVRASDTDSAADALIAASRGVRLIVVASGAEQMTFVGFLDDLTRLATPLPAAARESADSDRDALLTLLSQGLTVTAAAESMHVSRRTANRWLTQAQAEFGVDSNAELVRVWAAHTKTN